MVVCSHIVARSAITTGRYRRSAFQPRLQDLFKGTKTGRNSWGRIRNVLNSTVPTLGQCNSCPSAGRNACPSRKSRDISIVDLSAGLDPPFCPNCSPGYCHRHRIVESSVPTAGERGRWQHARDLSVMVEEDPVYCQWLLREAKDRITSKTQT